MSVPQNIDFEYELFANFAEPIIHLIDDLEVTEIYIDTWNRISYMKAGTVKQSDISFADEKSLMDLCEHLIKDVRGRNTRDSENYFSLNSTDGHRFSVHTPTIRNELDKYSITIRLFRALQMLHKRMIELGAFTEDQYDKMLDYLINGKNILICGKPNSGKTTIMRCLLNSIIQRDQPRIIFLEDPKELNLNYEKGFELEVDHKEENSASKALRFCLRNSPQILVLGEILDPDVARTFLESVEAGFSGAISTIHANNAKVATSRLATLAAKGSNVSRHDWLETANNTIDLVVYVSFDQITGERKITELYDVKKGMML